MDKFSRDQPVIGSQEERDLDILLCNLRRRRIVAILLQVRARIQELSDLVDFLEKQPQGLFDILNAPRTERDVTCEEY